MDRSEKRSNVGLDKSKLLLLDIVMAVDGLRMVLLIAFVVEDLVKTLDVGLIVNAVVVCGSMVQQQLKVINVVTNIIFKM